MTPPESKADAVSPAESSAQSPHKRLRSESIANITHSQDGDRCTPDEHSVLVPKPPSMSHTVALDGENKAAPSADLPRTWDQASDLDKMLVRMKEVSKTSWAKTEQLWERSTGEKPAEGALQSRYKHLKNIKAPSNHKVGRKRKLEAVEEPLDRTDDLSTPKTRKAMPSSHGNRGPPDRSSRATSQRSQSPGSPSESTGAAPENDDVPGHAIPQSWEQANAGDQLIMRMKKSRPAWSKIAEAWQELTGITPAEGALQDRYNRMKELVVPPKMKGAKIKTNAKSALRAPRTPRKPSVEEEIVDESSSDSSDQQSSDNTKEITTMARRQSRGEMKAHAKPSSLIELSDNRTTKSTKLEHPGPSDGEVEAGWSSDEIAKSSPAVSKSTQSSSAKRGVTAGSVTQDTVETADQMIVEMKERGCSWVEISQAWTERTGLTHAPETLRRRYAHIKKGTASQIFKASASSKRKILATSQDEDVHETPKKRSKQVAEIPHISKTPVKRNMDRGKRKSGVKFTESTTDEDELFAAPVEPAVTTSPVRRRASRAAKVDRTDPEWLVTNENSPVATEDLHAEFSNPKTYEQFTRSDWEDLRETLPPNVPLNPDGYSIPMTFFKYDPDFRRGIREFQEDLASGRLDPKWQADAAEAMEARARGDFDAYKEEQFEAFWGQKQKMTHGALAGESTKIKLDLLIQNDIFKVGDYFSYTRVFGRGKTGILIEKDCKIMAIDGKALEFAIPPGQRKYSRRMFESPNSGGTKAEPKATVVDGVDGTQQDSNGDPSDVQVAVATASNDGKLSNDEKATNGGKASIDEKASNHDKASEAGEKNDEALLSAKTVSNGTLPCGSEAQDVEASSVNKTNENGVEEAMNSGEVSVEANNKPLEDDAFESRAATEAGIPNGKSTLTNGDQSSTSSHKELPEDILRSISNLTELEHRIVDVDGRLNWKDLPASNAWKNFRGIRDNQDLGSLFEMREEFYVYKHPRIVKEPKRKR